MYIATIIPSPFISFFFWRTLQFILIDGLLLFEKLEKVDNIYQKMILLHRLFVATFLTVLLESSRAQDPSTYCRLSTKHTMCRFQVRTCFDDHRLCQSGCISLLLHVDEFLFFLLPFIFSSAVGKVVRDLEFYRSQLDTPSKRAFQTFVPQLWTITLHVYLFGRWCLVGPRLPAMESWHSLKSLMNDGCLTVQNSFFKVHTNARVIIESLWSLLLFSFLFCCPDCNKS